MLLLYVHPRQRHKSSICTLCWLPTVPSVLCDVGFHKKRSKVDHGQCPIKLNADRKVVSYYSPLLCSWVQHRLQILISPLFCALTFCTSSTMFEILTAIDLTIILCRSLQRYVSSVGVASVQRPLIRDDGLKVASNPGIMSFSWLQ